MLLLSVPRFAAMLLATTVASSTAIAQKLLPPNEYAPDHAVATQGGLPVTMAMIDARVAQLPRAQRAGFMDGPERIERTIQSLQLELALAKEARDLGLEKHPLVAVELDLALAQILARRRIEHFVETLEIPDLESLAHEQYLADPKLNASPELVDVSHVLVKWETRSREEARARAEKVRELALQPDSDFVALVAEYSDEGTEARRSSGRLPRVARGMMVPPFEEAAFALREEGEISPVVETEFGYHVIKLHARRDAETVPFESIKASLLTKLKEKYTEQRRVEYVNSLQAREWEADPDAVAHLRERYIPGNQGARIIDAPATAD